jgi:hypothetical protein
MPSKETLLKDLDWVTEKISTQIWVLNLGTLGTTWSLLITATIPDRFKLTFVQARWVFLFCFLALLCELGQYLSSYIMYRRILRDIEQRSQRVSVRSKFIPLDLQDFLLLRQWKPASFAHGLRDTAAGRSETCRTCKDD